MTEHFLAKVYDEDILGFLNEEFNLEEVDNFLELASIVASKSFTDLEGQTNGTTILLHRNSTKSVKQSRKFEDENPHLSSKKAVITYNDTSTARIPKPLTCPINITYPQMFFNSINSGDLHSVQGYFSAFMAGPCTFYVNHPVRPEFGVPSIVQAFSPKLFSHYLLGCFVTFPDMVLKLQGVKVLSNCLGYKKIVMETEVNASKIYDIPGFDWVPETAQLCDMYTLGTASAANPRPTALLHDVSNNNSITSSNNDLTTTTSVSCNVASSFGSVGTPDSSDDRSTSPDSVSSRKGFNKRKNKTPTGPELKLEGSPERVQALRQVPEIPISYMYTVLSQARLLPKSISLHTRGYITLYIDENNFMKHVDVDLRPVSSS